MSRSRKIIFWTCVAVALAAISYVFFCCISAHRSSVPTDLSLPTSVEEPVAEPEPEPYQSPIDFETIWKTGKDVYAWIRIPETKVDYPVARGGPYEDFYLEHAMDGKPAILGTIYTRMENKDDFSEFNTVFYGHNARNDNMFGGLKRYRDLNYLKEHRLIHIYTPQAEYTYQIFAAVVFHNKLLTAKYDFSTVEDRKAFLHDLKTTRDISCNFLEDVAVDENSKLITLSTCVSGRKDRRYVVVAVQIDENPETYDEEQR